MSSLVFGFATGPDLLRLLAVPVFAWAAYRDIASRRVPNRIWLPLLVFATVALVWDLASVLGAGAFRRRLFAVQVVFSLGFVAPLGYLFWRIGGFGGADAKAIITLAVLVPTYPAYYAFGGSYPIHSAPLGVFSFTILSNTVVIGLLYPLALAIRNVPRGDFTPAVFVGRRVPVEALETEHGRLLESTDGLVLRGLDIDALRMYLQWRGAPLENVRSDPDRFRDSIPTTPNDPGDGAIDDTTPSGSTDIEPVDEDPWGAETFLADHPAYGTTPQELRDGLDVVTEPRRERVWITPGIPFIVPMFFGLLLALTYGDLLFSLLSSLGLL